MGGTMPLSPSVQGVIDRNPGLPVLKAAGERPILEEGTETGPPAAATHRAEAIFETMGIALVLLIVLAAAWILIRKQL
jgi:hypothetical protein